MNHKAKFRDTLIKETIRNASKIPFYAGLWKQHNIDIDKITKTEHLNQLPVVDKLLYMTQYQDSMDQNSGIALVSYSSGTGGKISFRYRTIDEVQYIQRFFTSVYKLDEVAKGGGEAVPLAISFYNHYHGKRIPVPGNVYTLEAGLFEAGHADQVLSILQKDFRIANVENRVTQIYGDIKNHKALTRIMLSRGIDPAKLPVNVLVGTGGYSSRFLIDTLEEIWQAKFVNCYSLSEIFGAATLCPDCGWFHMDAHVVPEVIDPFTHEKINEGVGVLVLTELYPFIQFQPLIHYFTEDLVKAQISECPHDKGNISFQLLGRTWDAIIDKDSREILLYSSVLHEVLDKIPVVKKKAFMVDGDFMQDIGEPLWTQSVESTNKTLKLNIHIECRFDHIIYRKRAKQLRDRIYREILDGCPALSKGIEQGKYMLEIMLCFDRDLSAGNWFQPQ